MSKLVIISRYAILLIFFTGYSFFSNSQGKSKIDSLLRVLASTKHNDYRVDVLNEIAWNYQNSNLQKAKEYGEKGLRLGKKTNYPKGMVRSYYNIGNAYYLEGDYATALENYIAALHIMEELDDKVGIASGLLGIGNIHGALKEYDKALEYQFKSLEISESIHDTSGIAGSYNNLGVIYMEMEDFQSALKYHMKALEIKEIRNDYKGLSSSYGNLGTIFLKLGKSKVALDYQQKAFGIRKELGNRKGMVLSYSDMASIYEYEGNTVLAQQYYVKASHLAAEIGFSEGEKKSYKALSEMLEKKGDMTTSYEYFKKYTQLKDSVFNTEKSQYIQELQARFDIENKEKQIALLEKDKEIQNLALVRKESDLNRQKIIIGFGTAVIALILAAFIILFRSLRFKKEANRILETQNNEISLQSKIIADKNKDITDSLEYAKTIQDALLPSLEHIRTIFNEHFIFFKPKDIVSGDFYWVHKSQNGNIIWAAADCTGHGVPGAFMSTLGVALLNEIVIEKGIEETDAILNKLRSKIIKSLGDSELDDTNHDGMDIGLCVWSPKKNLLQFSGANNFLLITRFNEIIQYDGDKQPVGRFAGLLKPFTRIDIPLHEGDIIYMFSDGYIDQFGGPDNKKFMTNRFKNLLLNLRKLPMDEQKRELVTMLGKWMKGMEQIDDIIVFGVKV